jgi:tRNA(Ile)-lysidine synthetase-like protein
MKENVYDDLFHMIISFKKQIKGKKCLLAMSGGADSFFLFFLLYFCKDLTNGISVFHVNYQLRKESYHETKTLELFLKQLDINLYKYIYNNKADSLSEDSLRSFRYDKLFELSLSENYDIILTGHNRDDNIDSFLMRSLHGSGISGLKCINTISYFCGVEIYRPLLVLSRKYIESLMLGFDWFFDISNKSLDYERNLMRYFRGLLEKHRCKTINIAKTINKIDITFTLLNNDFYERVKDFTKISQDNYVLIDWGFFQQSSQYLQTNIIMFFIEHVSKKNSPTIFQVLSLVEKLIIKKNYSLGGCDVLYIKGIIFIRRSFHKKVLHQTLLKNYFIVDNCYIVKNCKGLSVKEDIIEKIFIINNQKVKTEYLILNIYDDNNNIIKHNYSYCDNIPNIIIIDNKLYNFPRYIF